MTKNELNLDELNKVAGGFTKQPTCPPTPTPFPAGPFDPAPLPYPVRR